MSDTWLKYRHEHPRLLLFSIFVAWKLLIVLVALASPGLGYDTSTSLLPWYDGTQSVLSATLAAPQNQWLKFVRWDAVYFTHIANQGHVYEQEWAFGIGLSSVLSWIGRNLPAYGICSGPNAFTVAGVIVSHTAHFLAVILLFELSTSLLEDNKKSYISFTAAALHIFSPAGIFLSAPSTESIFAPLSFLGFWAYLHAIRCFNHAKILTGCLNIILAGLAFGLATIIRSNGILAGIPFLIEAVTITLTILSRGLSLSRITRLASIVVGGLLVGLGMVAPQFIAYQEYCADRASSERRPWCEWSLPSIFTFVQSHYWNVGPFRYWTLSNVPLFLLAGPTLGLLTYSAAAVLRTPALVKGGAVSHDITALQKKLMASLALPQLMLAILAFSSYHVQIITRISSGYPLWYIWLAAKATDEPNRVVIVIRWMIIYALVQAGLYASFLPPA
ncbi:phosphatidylinositol glycan, class V [Exophiala viscosa]|uniref:phosphatidylinositol glycan, class V n=1 Tax=Exophiala viscosa TaxID=2486360 RepID=UPI002193DF7E|nr:phosphatidylinositol glycan, class V [Exophiala viscosa]